MMWKRDQNAAGTVLAAKLGIGRIAEEEAKKLLKKKGYKVIEQNWKTKKGEIDLVARLKDKLVFVEVRSRTGERFGSPEDTIGKKKIQKIILNARAYAKIYGFEGLCQIDAVCVVFSEDGKSFKINHYENIGSN